MKKQTYIQTAVIWGRMCQNFYLRRKNIFLTGVVHDVFLGEVVGELKG